MTLYFAPDTCARVPLIALEEIGHPYSLEVVAFMKGQHRSPEYLALNPKGKYQAWSWTARFSRRTLPSFLGCLRAFRTRICCQQWRIASPKRASFPTWLSAPRGYIPCDPLTDTAILLRHT